MKHAPIFLLALVLLAGTISAQPPYRSPWDFGYSEGYAAALVRAGAAPAPPDAHDLALEAAEAADAAVVPMNMRARWLEGYQYGFRIGWAKAEIGSR